MPNFFALKEGRTIVEVSVKDNNVEGALRILKKRCKERGFSKKWKCVLFLKNQAKKNLEKKLKILEDLEKMQEERFIVDIYKDLIIPSTIFFASENNIIVFSR